MKALALKELRELRGIAALALAAYLILVARVTGVKAFEWAPGPQDCEYPPFLQGAFLSYFCMAAAIFAIVLGFRQSAWESSQGTYLFLLHRPVSRQMVFIIKLAIGLSVFVCCSCVPIVVYGWWAATPGLHASPFRWSWTLQSLAMIGVTSMIYFGAFLSGLRPAKWFGTRLLPLFAAILLSTIMPLASTKAVWQVSAVLPAATIFYCGIRYVVEERDYA